MKLTQVLLVALSLSAFGVTSEVWARGEIPPQGEVQKGETAKGPQFHRPMSMAMMKDLNLTSEQKTRWKDLSHQKHEELKPIRNKIKELHEQEQKINDVYEGKIKEMLTPEQKKKYESMIKKKPERLHDMPHRPDKKSEKK